MNDGTVDDWAGVGLMLLLLLVLLVLLLLLRRPVPIVEAAAVDDDEGLEINDDDVKEPKLNVGRPLGKGSANSGKSGISHSSSFF